MLLLVLILNSIYHVLFCPPVLEPQSTGQRGTERQFPNLPGLEGTAGGLRSLLLGTDPGQQGSPFLLQRVFQHLDTPHQVRLEILLPFPFSLEESHLSLGGTEGNRKTAGLRLTDACPSLTQGQSAPAPTPTMTCSGHFFRREHPEPGFNGAATGHAGSVSRVPCHVTHHERAEEESLTLDIKMGNLAPAFWGEVR